MVDSNLKYLSLEGKGMYGTVWKSLQQETKEIVAVKRFERVHESVAMMDLALREIKLLHRMEHPNIVRLKSAFKSKNGRMYMVMDYVDYSLLRVLHMHPNGLPKDNLKLMLYQILHATHYMHSLAIMHRDLKPANILVTEEGDIKLCDFGFAREMPNYDALSYTPYTTTRWYRAPEVLVGSSYSCKVDIWAIGCLFAEMAEGHALFPGDSSLDQLSLIESCTGLTTRQQKRMGMMGGAQMKTRVRTTLEDRFPEASRPFLEVLRACLQPDPGMRASAAQLLSMPYFFDVEAVASRVRARPSVCILPSLVRGGSLNKHLPQPTRRSHDRSAATHPAVSSLSCTHLESSAGGQVSESCVALTVTQVEGKPEDRFGCDEGANCGVQLSCGFELASGNATAVPPPTPGELAKTKPAHKLVPRSAPLTEGSSNSSKAKPGHQPAGRPAGSEAQTGSLKRTTRSEDKTRPLPPGHKQGSELEESRALLRAREAGAPSRPAMGSNKALYAPSPAACDPAADLNWLPAAARAKGAESSAVCMQAAVSEAPYDSTCGDGVVRTLPSVCTQHGSSSVTKAGEHGRKQVSAAGCCGPWASICCMLACRQDH